MDEELRKLREYNELRRREAARVEINRRIFVGQLMRFGICPCIPMGRYTTCCKGLENVQDGFFHINRRAP